MNRFKDFFRNTRIIIFTLSLFFAIIVGRYLNYRAGVAYDQANALLESGRYQEAVTTLSKYKGFRDVDEIISDANEHIVYERAIKLYENKQFEEALSDFLSIGPFLDSESYIAKCNIAISEKSKEIVYDEGKKYFDTENYEEAIKDFDQIKEYKDANNLLKLSKAIIKRNELSTTVVAGIRYTAMINDNGDVKLACNDGNDIFDFTDWSDLVSISGGGNIFLGLSKAGKVYSDETKDFYLDVDTSSWDNIIQISAGEQFAIGLTYDGKVEHSGRNYENQSIVKNWMNIIKVDAANRTIVGLNDKGELAFAGYKSEYLTEIYNNNKNKYQNIKDVKISGGMEKNDPIHVAVLSEGGELSFIGDSFDNSDNKEKINNIRIYDVGNNHLIAIDNEDNIIVKGNPGTKDYPLHDEKELINYWPANEIVYLGAGLDISIALTKSGEVFAAGNDKQGQLGANSWKNAKVIMN